MNQDWNAGKYAEGFSFVYKYGHDVLNLIDAPEGSSVIDLGCGTGILTNALSERGYNVIGIDASDDMLAQARANFPAISFIHADAADFMVNAPVNAVFSNAVLHWIDRDNQPKMMKCVHEALKTGGQFVFEMGGFRCAGMIHDMLADMFKKYGYDYVMPFYFPSIGEYASMLEAEGFSVRYALLFDRPTELAGNDGLYDWINMFVKIPFMSVNASDRENILRDTVDALRDRLFHDGKWYADYVRLRMRALKV